MTFCSGVALMGVLAAGCGGGGSSPGVASIGSATTTSLSTAFTPTGNSGSASVEVRYVLCIQAHGVPNFPEPGPNASAAMKQIDFSSPTFKSAMSACKKLIPKDVSSPPVESPKVQAEALKFTSCMRAHGMTNWPEPLPGGGYVPEAFGAAASSPVYLKAAKACDPLLPKG